MPCHVRELEEKLEEYKKITVDPQFKEPFELYNDMRVDPRKSNNQFWPGWC